MAKSADRVGAALGAQHGWLRANSLNGGNGGLSSLGNVPVANLLVIVLGLPLMAAAAGWLLAGRQPPDMSYQPIE
jgi:putative ABC transport system permease protein